jgi:hypothetical protein
MMTLVGEKGRPTPNPKTIDAATKVRLYDTTGGYAGTYSFDGETVVHHVDRSIRQLPPTLLSCAMSRCAAID